MWQKWFAVSLSEVGFVALSVLVIYATILLLTRIFGLRSFSKMASGDFAMTVAVGSLFGTSIVSPEPSVGSSVVAFTCLFAGQFLIAWSRRRTRSVSRVLDNRPILLVRSGEILHDNLHVAHVSVDDLRAKLREANVFRLEEVHAVVFETTGDVSVLHGDPDDELEPFLLESVRRE